MKHPRLILHVGGAKCGSSALQTVLSSRLQLTAPGTPKLAYAALTAKQGLVHGETLLNTAGKQGFGYASSSIAPDLRDMDLTIRDRMLADLKGLLEQNDYVVVSNESWLTRFDVLSENGFLDALGTLGEPFVVFAAVRPQSEVINSGWWQWGAWAKSPNLDKWIKRRLPQSLWHTHLSKWRGHPACARVATRLLSRDIVGDFFAAFGLTPASEIRQGASANVSLPGEVLRLFQRHPEIRDGRALVDFILSEFGLGERPTPWILSQDAVRHIIDTAREDNEALCASLLKGQAMKMRNTAGWWSADAYASRPLEPALCPGTDAVAAFEMQTRLQRALAEVSEQLLVGPALSQTLLPPEADPGALDAQNAELAKTLITAAMDLRRQNAA